jgi:hypothetical protein
MFKKILLLLLVLVIAAVAAVYFFGGSALNNALRKAVETYGPPMTGGPVTLESVDIAVRDGRGVLSGLVVGNPPGFTTDKAMSIGTIEVKLDPGSVLGETVLIERIAIDAPELVLERAGGTTNLQAIQKNIEEATARPTETTPEDEGEGKKLAIKEFVLTNTKVTVSAIGQVRELTLPTIRLTEMGTAEGGVPPAEIASAVMAAILREVGKQAQQIGVQFLQDPQGSLDAARDHLDRLKEQAGGAGEAVNQLRGLLGGGRKKEEPPPAPAD